MINHLNFRNKLTRPRLNSPTPALYHYEYQDNGERSRVHLRIDPDQSGVLLINAGRVFYLNPSAATMAYLALEKVPCRQAISIIKNTFNVSKKQALNDYLSFTNQINQLVQSDDVCPIHDLDLDIIAPFGTLPTAPYRMDLALTYQCNNDCSHCYNARPRDYPELTTAEWFLLIDKVWQIGIPHIVFTGGEPTLRSDLPDLIKYAETKGMITGLNTNGRRLSDLSYLKQLVDSGLDHVQITIESHNPDIHDQLVQANGAWKQTVTGLRNALDSNIYVMTNTTMLQLNSPFLNDTLDFLAQAQVPTVGLNAMIYSGKGVTVGTGLAEEKLITLLDLASSKTEANNQRLIWYTPTQYCRFDPTKLGLGVKGCTAALYNMCVEPDGSVIPCQSYYQSLGNILTDSWKSIWDHELSINLRNRSFLPDKCGSCDIRFVCGGGCPLTFNLPTVI
jgi:radical SAM protein with 4Fe4S-binding SPASM domain